MRRLIWIHTVTMVLWGTWAVSLAIDVGSVTDRSIDVVDVTDPTDVVTADGDALHLPYATALKWMAVAPDAPSTDPDVVIGVQRSPQSVGERWVEVVSRATSRSPPTPA